MENKCFFKIIIPVYNCKEYIKKCIQSIESQTFQDFSIVIIDDVSTDGTREIIQNLSKQYNNITPLFMDSKVWNGGARNIGIRTKIDSQYTLFIDSDDWLSSNDCLEELYNIIINNNYPDCIKMNYNILKDNKITVGTKWLFDDRAPQGLLISLSVAVWTKCIKTELVQLFPENTLMEDEIHHIKQCDNINNVVLCKKPIITWNRDNINSCTSNPNKKWESSKYRYLADLMDLKCNHDYCEQYRLKRVEEVKNMIRRELNGI